MSDLKCVMRKLEQIQARQKEHTEELQVLRELVTLLSTTQVEPEEQPFSIPITSLEDLEKAETLLSNPRTQKWLVRCYF